jgi:ABC-type multidrug transport system ATPase subunit
MSGNTMLELRNVVKTFTNDVRAVDGVSLSLERGVVGLIGATCASTRPACCSD